MIRVASLLLFLGGLAAVSVVAARQHRRTDDPRGRTVGDLVGWDDGQREAYQLERKRLRMLQREERLGGILDALIRGDFTLAGAADAAAEVAAAYPDWDRIVRAAYPATARPASAPLKTEGRCSPGTSSTGWEKSCISNAGTGTPSPGRTASPS